MSPSKCICSSPFRNLVSCSLLIFFLYSLDYISCGDVIYGTFVVYLAAYTIVSTTCTNVSIANGSTLPLIIFCAIAFVFSRSFLTLEPEAPPSLVFFFSQEHFLEICCSFFSIFQCYLHLLASSLYLGWRFLWILLLVHKQIPKDFLLLLRWINRCPYLPYSP
jgi:hypothetical protein